MAADGDWGTYTPFSQGFLGHENYTKPLGATNGIFTFCCGYNISYHRNITLPADCLAINPVELYMNSTSDGLVDLILNINCFYSTEWVHIYYDYCSGSNQYWESGMWWEISATTGVVAKNPILSNIIPLIISIGILLSIITTIFGFESQDPKETAGEILGIIIIIIIVVTALKIYTGL
jgi:hypothetical protein